MLFELVSSMVGLALKPLLLAKISCQIGVRSLSIVILTWLDLLRFVLSLHFVMLWHLAIWTMALLSLPVRAFTALYRERLLEIQFRRLKNEMKNVLLGAKELEEQLHDAIKEHEMTEMCLIDLEKEHDEAILKIKLLEGEVQDLKDETQRLREVLGKALWSYMNKDNGQITGSVNTIRYDNKHVVKDICDEMHYVLKAGTRWYGLSQLFISRVISREDVLARQREVALSQSLFSVILSIVVGIISWEAKNPCIPLVIALFVVVTMSLLSVLQLFTIIEHKPTSESLALLSINWFILGTLAYPLLPKIAGLLTPLAMSILRQALE